MNNTTTQEWNATSGELKPQILGINSLFGQPLSLVVPEDKLVRAEDGTVGLPYDFIHSVDRVLRTVAMNVPQNAYDELDRELGLVAGEGEPDFWHRRHWDDTDDLATFSVRIPDDHPSDQIAGRNLLATTQYRLMANPCLAPQIETDRQMRMLVDESGNMVLPFDEPLDADGNPVSLGVVLIDKEQFPLIQQAEVAAELLREFGYNVEIA